MDVAQVHLNKIKITHNLLIAAGSGLLLTVIFIDLTTILRNILLDRLASVGSSYHPFRSLVVLLRVSFLKSGVLFFHCHTHFPFQLEIKVWLSCNFVKLWFQVHSGQI